VDWPSHATLALGRASLTMKEVFRPMDMLSVYDQAGAPRLQLSRTAVLRVENAAVHVGLAGSSFTMPAGVHEVLQEFARPRSANEVFEGVEAGFSRAEFHQLVGKLEASGLLVRPDSERSIEEVLRPGLFGDAGLRERLRNETTSGRMCVIRDAFAPGFAAGVAGALETSTAWQPNQDFSQPFFHYSHHNIYDPQQFTGDLLRCYDIFGSPASKRAMGEIFGVDCGGALNFGASVYLPGDYSLPHDDRLGPRSLAYVWHLSRDWDPRWGGHLYWAPTMTYLKPTFNTLIVFPVSRRSWHFVCPVSPYAKSRRLTVNGWWTFTDQTAEATPEEPPLVGPPEGADWLSSVGDYDELSDDIFVF
jgi:hypothetical protein